MRVAEWEAGLEDSIDIREFELNCVNREEYENSERTFSQYLDYPRDEYFGHHKMMSWPAEFGAYYESAREYLKGDVLELGAGSCKFSALLSREPDVRSVTCVEFSRTMLRHIAPRVFLHFEGDLTKAHFVIADMHAVENFSDRKYDAIVFHSALHHVFLPYQQVKKLKEVLKPGGSILCFSEPCTSNLALPTKANKRWVLNQKKHQMSGNNENYYRVGQYKDFFTTFLDFEFQYLFPRSAARPLKRLLQVLGVDRVVWHTPLSVSFRATDVSK